MVRDEMTSSAGKGGDDDQEDAEPGAWSSQFSREGEYVPQMTMMR